MGNSRKILRLNTMDNVAVVCQDIEKGEVLRLENEVFHIEQPIRLGHKIALKNITPEEKIIKYGVSIGSATQRIHKGALVHIHNMKSDFIATYTMDSQ